MPLTNVLKKQKSEIQKAIQDLLDMVPAEQQRQDLFWIILMQILKMFQTGIK